MPLHPINRSKCIKITAGIVFSFFFFIWSASTPWIGWCPESKLEIAAGSRLPIWFKIPPGYERKDLTVEIYHYVPPPPFKQNFKAILLGPAPDHNKIDKKFGVYTLHPSMEKKKNEHGGFNPDVWPIVVTHTIDGISEILEQKKAEPLLYVSDDSALRRAIELSK